MNTLQNISGVIFALIGVHPECKSEGESSEATVMFYRAEGTSDEEAMMNLLNVVVRHHPSTEDKNYRPLSPAADIVLRKMFAVARNVHMRRFGHFRDGDKSTERFLLRLFLNGLFQQGEMSVRERDAFYKEIDGVK